MSDFKELIKNFSKTREYVRDFFVYGFKTREDFNEKSARTYDNERRRLESWLAPYIQRDFVENGVNLSLAIDSNLLDSNPLYQVWKTKSFTDNDIMLHFFLLDLLQDGSKRTADEITNALVTTYDVLFDLQIVRRKCNAYEKEGLLCKEKQGKKLYYFLDLSLPRTLRSMEGVWDALSFFQLAEAFGIVSNVTLEQMDRKNTLFRVKHSFFVHTLEDEILLSLIHAMQQQQQVSLTIKSSKNSQLYKETCIPLQIFVSTKSGRRFLCAYTRRKRFICYRLDTIKEITADTVCTEYPNLLKKLEKNKAHLWNVSFQVPHKSHLQTLTMYLQVHENREQYILTRLEQEGRGGTVTQEGQNLYKYQIQVFDCNEMLPWIRSFTGRIVSLECTDRSVEKRFYKDLESMYEKYQIM